MKPREWFARHGFWIAALGTLGVLAFVGLGDTPLWQDEAETALLARNTQRYGIPLAFDGRMVVSQNFGREFGPDSVWLWSPWLQFYLTALSFSFFGWTSLAARLPFVLIAIGAVPLFHSLGRKVTTSERAARLATALLVTSVPFLLHARQCRWYMPAVFATLWLLHAYLGMRDGDGKRASALQFVLAAAILHYSSFLSFVGVLGGVGAHYAWATVRGWPRPDLRGVGGAFASIFALTFPWFVYSQGWSRANPAAELPLGFVERVATISLQNAARIDEYLFPVVFVPGVVWVFRGLKMEEHGSGRRSDLALIVTVVLASVLLLSVMPWSFFRYLVVLIPLCCLLLGTVVNELVTRSKVVGYACLFALVLTNLFSLPLTADRLRFDLVDYVREIFEGVEGPNAGIVAFLEQHGDSSQLVKTNYGQLPIAFHTGMRAIGFGQDLRTPEPADWVIVRRGWGEMESLREVSKGYRKLEINAPDLPYGDRPDPAYRRIRSEAKRGEAKTPRIVVFARPGLIP